MKTRRKKINWNRFVVIFTLISLILAAIAVSIIIAFSPSQVTQQSVNSRVKSDYVLMLMQCILGIVAICLPSILNKKINLEIPYFMITLYAIFLYCAIFLGEVRSFYYTVPHWDTLLHTFSGAMIGALGFSIINFLNNSESTHLNLSPIFVATFAFCFSGTLGIIWEIYEFLGDAIMGTNMQKFALETGEFLVGSEALSDTMKDLIVDLCGAFIMSIIGYISLKYKKGWIEKVLVKRRKNENIT